MRHSFWRTAIIVSVLFFSILTPKISFAKAWCCSAEGGALRTYDSLSLCTNSNPQCSPSGTTGLTGTCKEGTEAAATCAAPVAAPDTSYVCCRNELATSQYATLALCTAAGGQCTSCIPSGQTCTVTMVPATTTAASPTPAATATPAQLSGRVTLPNPLGTTSPEELIGRVIKALLSIVGSLALLMFIYGGILWLTAGGSSEGVKKGQEIIKWSVAGILLIFTAYIILRYVLGALQGTFTP